jgi:hypothetical protein
MGADQCGHHRGGQQARPYRMARSLQRTRVSPSCDHRDTLVRSGLLRYEGQVAMKTSRCAIYTRKSSEEGLDQSFSSLHAQREACEAYVLSQKHEGWRVLSAKYDGGGFSGGNMQRPGLKKLLGDIAAGKIDTGRQAACRSGLRQADSKPALVLGGATPTFHLPPDAMPLAYTSRSQRPQVLHFSIPVQERMGVAALACEARRPCHVSRLVDVYPNA